MGNGVLGKEDDGYHINLVDCFERVPMIVAWELRSEFAYGAPGRLTEVVGDGAAIAHAEDISTHRL